MATNENLPPKVIKQLAKELKSLDESPPEDIRVHVNDDNFSTILADIEGPPGTPYEGGVFRIRLLLSQDFPQSPPKGYFLTKIFHPNIAKNGEICVNTLKKDWKPTLGLRHVLLAIRCLLIEPFPESALNEEAGKMMMDDYGSYSKHARLLTGIHAMKSKLKVRMSIAESTTINSTMPETNIISHTPLIIDTTNKGSAADPGVNLSCAETVAEWPSPSAKITKGDLLLSAVSIDKKKIDVHKKSLRRL